MEKSSVPLPTSTSSSSSISAYNMINVLSHQNPEFLTSVQSQRFFTALSPSSNSRLHMPNSTALQTGLPVPCVDKSEPVTQPMALPACPFGLGQLGFGTSIPSSPSQVSACSGIQGSYFFKPHTEQGAYDAPRLDAVHNSPSLPHQRSLSLGGVPSIGSYFLDPKNQIGCRGEQETFITSNGKRLRVLLTKKFRNCDAGSPCRIILPKKQAEENLPPLAEKEGIQLVIRDLYTDRKWSMKYKYWDNSSGRVYVLYCAKEFLNEKGVEPGDSITLYEDESTNLYISFQKAGSETLYDEQVPSEISGYLWGPSTSGGRVDEDEYLAILIEELNYKDQGDTNCLSTL